MSKTILMIVTSHGYLDNGRHIGVWFEEFVTPDAIFKKAGYDVVVVSPKGGDTPIDARSLVEADSSKFGNETKALLDTKTLDGIQAEDYTALFLPGGHGPMFDTQFDDRVAKIVTDFSAQEKPIAAVCHGQAALFRATKPNGDPLVKGEEVTGFSNEEEEQAGTVALLPNLIETTLRELGGQYSHGDAWQAHVVGSGKLITGQNAASSHDAAGVLVGQLA